MATTTNSVPIVVIGTMPPPAAPAPGKIQSTMNHSERLFHYSHSHSTQNNELYSLEFDVLHRANIIQLQIELAKLKDAVYQDAAVSDVNVTKIRETLRDYATALRDYEYIKSRPIIPHPQAESRRHDLASAFPSTGNLPSNPLNDVSHRVSLTGSSGAQPETADPLRMFLKAKLPKSLTYTDHEAIENHEQFNAGVPPIAVSPIVDIVAKGLVALVGGLSLLIPMLVMSNQPSAEDANSYEEMDAIKRTNIIITTVFVVAFSVGLATTLRARYVEILVATATYAAVLVIFIGN